MRSTMAVAVAALAAACAARAPGPTTTLGALRHNLPAFLEAHPLAPGAGIRVDEVSRTAAASYHVVQVRDRESPHVHARHDLAVLVLRGRGVLTLGDRTVALGPDDLVVVPRGMAHWFAPEGGQVAVALVAFTPPLDAPDSVPADSAR